MSFRTDKKRGVHPITPKKGIKEVDLNIKEKGNNDTIAVSITPKKSKFDPYSIKGGDIVAFRNPFADGYDERSYRFVVLEDRGDRVLIRQINNLEGLTIIPTAVMAKSHLINANQDSPELAKSHGD